MTTLREAAQQALEILERLHGGCTDSDDGTVEAITIWVPEIIDALRAALAEPVQEPVAWLFTNLQSGDYDFCYCEDEHDHDREMWHKQPLYAAPPQRQPLSDDEIAQAMYRADAIFTGPMQFRFAREIERAHDIT